MQQEKRVKKEYKYINISFKCLKILAHSIQRSFVFLTSVVSASRSLYRRRDCEWKETDLVLPVTSWHGEREKRKHTYLFHAAHALGRFQTAFLSSRATKKEPRLWIRTEWWIIILGIIARDYTPCCHRLQKKSLEIRPAFPVSDP